MKLCILFIVMTVGVRGQSVLDEYLRYGIDKNLALQQKQTDYERSIEALKEARGLFYPRVILSARYSVADGGRVIDFPVGSMLNPVYSTLNNLTASNVFPNIENMQFRFLRPNEHETHLRLFQPLLNTDIYFNSRIRKEMVDIKLEEARREIKLQVLSTMNELLTAEKGIVAAGSRLVNAREAFRLVSRKYEEGQASLLEYIDSRTMYTRAEENLIVSRFSYLSCFSEFEKVTALNRYE